MKILDKMILILFSIIILIISIVMLLLVFGIVSYTTISTLYAQVIANATATNITIAISVICILLAVKAIFFGSTSKSSNGLNGEGILLENESGKLLISKETIENLVNSQNTLKVFVTLMVLPNTVINELSINLQTRIKEVVKKVTDLDIKAIDIKIKNITTPEENKEG